MSLRKHHLEHENGGAGCISINFLAGVMQDDTDRAIVTDSQNMLIERHFFRREWVKFLLGSQLSILTWTYYPGHAGVNERVDKLAGITSI